MSERAQPQPMVSGSAVIAAGFASTVAAAVTSKFGVAGTIVGAGVTAMLVTGGSAVLRSYFESAAGKVREMPGRVRGRTGSRDMARFGKGAKKGGLGRFSRAMEWFSGLPAINKRSILKKGLIGALIAFVIAILIVTFTEVGIGGTLSCKIWGNCAAADTRPSILGGGAKAGSPPAPGQNANPIKRFIPGSNQPGGGPVAPQGGGANQQATPTATARPAPTVEPEATPTAEPAPTAEPQAAPTAKPQAAPTAEPQPTATAEPQGAGQ